MTSFPIYIVVFYVIDFLLMLTIFSLVFINYSYQKKSTKPSWTVSFSKIMLFLLQTIFFFPFIEFAASILKCVQIQGQLTHQFFPDEKCWESLHLLHSTVAMLSLLLFLLITFVSSYFLFESRSISRDGNARYSGKGHLFCLSFQVIGALCLTFLWGEEYEFLHMGYVLGFSGLIFQEFYYVSPFFEENVGRVWRWGSAGLLWTAIMMCFAVVKLLIMVVFFIRNFF